MTFADLEDTTQDGSSSRGLPEGLGYARLYGIKTVYLLIGSLSRKRRVDAKTKLPTNHYKFK